MEIEVNKSGRSLRWTLVLVAAVVAVWWLLSLSPSRGPGDEPVSDVDLSLLVARVNERPRSIDRVVFDPSSKRISVTLVNDKRLTAHYPSDAAQVRFQALLERRGVDFASKAPSGGGLSRFWPILVWLVPMILLGALLLLGMRRAAAGQSQILGFGRSKAKRVRPDMPKVHFTDVAGANEAVEELRELEQFLASPRRFRALGARIPKGVLLHGPPGTGKTLLARAVAGEAGVPFFAISGSDFVEMFVGVGAARVRDLFTDAKAAAPAIVFIDELDAVGRHRGAGLGGGHDEREQTLNQLLVELDGFDVNENVIVIAGTNRPDILDPALLRPGRFDRQILVDRPDRLGRLRILEIHAKGKPLGREIDLDAIAAATPGMTGADLANLLNEAALLAGRRGKGVIEQSELDEGVLRVVAGPERKSRILSERERRTSAYHELGHALVGHFLEHAEKPQRISITRRGQALGYTIAFPAEDRLLTTRSELMDQLAMMLGGRASEEVVFDEITTGATNDLEQATQLATEMVTRLGMSDEFGPRVLRRDPGAPFLGREFQVAPEHSEKLARTIDEEVHRLIEEAHQRASDLIGEHLDDLHRLAEILIERETLDGNEFERLLAEPRKLAGTAGARPR